MRVPLEPVGLAELVELVDVETPKFSLLNVDVVETRGRLNVLIELPCDAESTALSWRCTRAVPLPETPAAAVASSAV